MNRALALAVVALALSAHAQGSSSEPGYVLVLATTAAPALIFDIIVAKNLLDDGMVRKGYAVNTVIFGLIATTIGGGLALMFWGDTRVKPFWMPIGVGLAVIGLGSAVLGAWGMFHVRRPPEEVLPADPPPGDFVPLAPSAPALPDEIPLIRVTPLFGVTPSGSLLFGLSGTLP